MRTSISTARMFTNPRTSVSQSVKEVLQSLVDDGLVQMDKIGSSNCEQRLSVEGYD